MKRVSLRKFDDVTAAGILARAALSLSGENNPAASIIFPDEKTVRENIIKEILNSLGEIYPTTDPEILDKIGDILEMESNDLLAPIDESSGLKSLSDKGELPTDLFDISINDELLDIYSKRSQEEKRLMEIAVRSPDRQQHFTTHHQNGIALPLVSLFAKHFKNKYPQRNFTMLVVEKWYASGSKFCMANL